MEDEKYIKPAGLWTFSVIFLDMFSILFFIPVVLIVSEADGLSQELFQYLIVAGICASSTLPFVELYMEGKYRKSMNLRGVRFWRNFTLYHWLLLSLLLYAVFSDLNPIVSKGYI